MQNDKAPFFRSKPLNQRIRQPYTVAPVGKTYFRLNVTGALRLLE